MDADSGKVSAGLVWCYLVRFEELHICAEFGVAAVLAVGDEVNAAGALRLDRIRLLLHLIHPASRAEANHPAA